MNLSTNEPLTALLSALAGGILTHNQCIRLLLRVLRGSWLLLTTTVIVSSALFQTLVRRDYHRELERNGNDPKVARERTGC